MFNLPQIQVPLVSCPDGRVKIENTGVFLEHIIDDFEDGVIADEIVTRHNDLRLSDVFLVVSFYLKNRKEVEDYLALIRPAETDVGLKPMSAA